MSTAANFLYHALIDSPGRWHPLLAVYYLTYACRFRCPYCADGNGVPYHQKSEKILRRAEVARLLREVRKHCSYLVLTGGEPLQHPDIKEILGDLAALRFRGVILTTNGHDLLNVLPLLSKGITELVVSLDTLSAAKADQSYGVGPGALERIIANLEQAAQLPGRRFDIVISSVVTPDNLEDVLGVCEFAWHRGFRVAVCPQLLGVRPHPDLVESSRYRRLFDRLIARKQAGARVEGSRAYLERMRDLGQFRCRPFTMLTLSPLGDVFYPCLELGQVAGNLLEQPNLNALRRRGQQLYGPQPACGVQCHSACALGFATALDKPWTLVGEGWRQARDRRLALRPRPSPPPVKEPAPTPSR